MPFKHDYFCIKDFDTSYILLSWLVVYVSVKDMRDIGSTEWVLRIVLGILTEILRVVRKERIRC